MQKAADGGGGGGAYPAVRLRQRPAAERAAYTAAAARGDSSSGDEHASGGSECNSSDLDASAGTSGGSSDAHMSKEDEKAAGAAPGSSRGGGTSSSRRQQAGISNPQRSKRRHTSSGSEQVPKRQKTNSAAARQAGYAYSHAVEVLPGGNRQVHMDENIRADTRRPSTPLHAIYVPQSLVTACFPDLPCEVNLELTVDGQAADLAAPVTAQLKLTQSKDSRGRTQTHVRCTGVSTVLRSYLGHTITRMAANTNGQQLTLHLASPAAVQAAAAAAAAEAAATGWHVYNYKGGGKKTLATSAGSRQLYIPAKLFSSAFPGPPPLPFKVQLAVFKDGGLIAGDSVDDVSVTSIKAFRIPAALAPQVSGCEVHQLKAAAPNTLQIHVKSTAPTQAAVDSVNTATAAGTAGAGPIAAAGPPQHGSNARSRRGSAAAPAGATPSGPDSQAGQQQQQQQQAKKKRQCSAAAAAATLSLAAPAALAGVVDPVTAGSGPGVMAAAQPAAAAAAGGIDALGGRVKGQAAQKAACAADVPAGLATTMDPKGAQQHQQLCAAPAHPRFRFADMSESEVTADDAGGDAGRQQLQDTATQHHHHQQVAPITSQLQKQGSSCLAGGEQCGLNSNNPLAHTAAPATLVVAAADAAASAVVEAVEPPPTLNKPAHPGSAGVAALLPGAIQTNAAAGGAPMLAEPAPAVAAPPCATPARPAHAASAASGAGAVDAKVQAQPLASAVAADGPLAPAASQTQQAAAGHTGQVGCAYSGAGLAAAAVVDGAGGVLPLPASTGLEGFAMRPASADPVPVHEAWVQLLALFEQMQAPKQQRKRLQAAMRVLDGLLPGDERRARFNAHYAEVQVWVKQQDVEEVWDAVDFLIDKALA